MKSVGIQTAMVFQIKTDFMEYGTPLVYDGQTPENREMRSTVMNFQVGIQLLLMEKQSVHLFCIQQYLLLY